MAAIPADTAVAPHAGAWIETTMWTKSSSRCRKSHPTRVRGLKHAHQQDHRRMGASHPTRVRGLKLCLAGNFHGKLMSHPTRVRGLKRAGECPLSESWRSHPTRVRGLKHSRPPIDPCSVPVAPHAGAWIETHCGSHKDGRRCRSHPTRVRGLKLPRSVTAPGR